MAESFTGIGVSPGLAVGPAHVLERRETEVTEARAPEEELRAFDEAVSLGVAQLADLAAALRREGREAQAGIFDAQALMLQDHTLLQRAHARIAAGDPAARAMQETAAHFKAQFEALNDPYMSARAADVQDIADRVSRNLGPVLEGPSLERASVLVAHDLTPSETASLDRGLVLAIVCDAGSPTSHTAILARALGIPAVVALGDISQRVQSGQEIAVDGESGTVVVAPDEAQKRDYAVRLRAQEDRRRRLAALRNLPAETRDGRRLTLAANIGSPEDLPAALEAGAEGVGLYRTEFLFAGRDAIPDEAEQVRAYRAALEAMPQTIVIRTLDVGGDKPLPYLPAPAEANPFLGERGIRFTLAHQDLFRTQLRALLRASAYGRLAIMFPMVSESAEIERARSFLEEARGEVGGEAEVGIMIEVPAAALIADRLARHVSFFSVGTNDLVQYALAVDRVNERVAPLYQPLHPAVLRLLAGTVAGAHAESRWAGVCGEMAGDLLAIPILVGLGFDELSMTPSRIPAAKERIRSLELAACQRLAGRALECETAEAVAQLVRETVT